MPCIFIVRWVQHYFPSSTDIKFCVWHTSGASDRVSLFPAEIPSSITIDLQQKTLRILTFLISNSRRPWYRRVNKHTFSVASIDQCTSCVLLPEPATFLTLTLSDAPVLYGYASGGSRTCTDALARSARARIYVVQSMNDFTISQMAKKKSNPLNQSAVTALWRWFLLSCCAVTRHAVDEPVTLYKQEFIYIYNIILLVIWHLSTMTLVTCKHRYRVSHDLSR